MSSSPIISNLTGYDLLYFLATAPLPRDNKLTCIWFLQARSFNVDPDLVRISVGLEEVSDLRGRFQRALDAVEKVAK
jgi:hypothetical protein